MEGAPPSFVDDNVSFTWNQLEIDKLMSELRWYVIIKHILSEDDCLQFSFSTVFLIMTMETGCHRRRFQSTKAPCYAMIKLDRRRWWIMMWSTIVFSRQLGFHLHFLKPWWVVTTHALFISSAEIMGVWYGFWGICFVFISFLIN